MTLNPPTFRRDLEHTQSLAEAIYTFFGRTLEERLCIFDSEAMEGEVAQAYNDLGLQSRRETYKRIAEDFRLRTQYSDDPQHQRRILEVGCGSGLLTLTLAEQTIGMIFGLDVSADMIALANKNKENKRQEIMEKIIREYACGGYTFSLPNPAARDPMPEIVDAASAITGRARFVQGSVYNLTRPGKNEKSMDYVVCRNALHRFRDPKEALRQMHSILRDGGKIYIRDLKRDADWKTVLDRIGESRWKTPALVRDYLGAMAAMLTVEELATTLRELDINRFTITDGSYKSDATTSTLDFKEYEQAIEYVCVIEK
ncbi:MAG: class I SAM-dependent methyltransferase [Candidatus Woesearchaeota archaeon]|nr:class I SAM-dependent methyltransferase [Candidatus Woesearchaeota archaeon]